jgi:glyoxylase-like metal-dependent hydrolase (beta-lactamase superfamily II)
VSADGAKTRAVADGVWQVCLPLPMRPTIVNVWLVRGGDGFTLVDTGMHTGDSMGALRGALAAVGAGERDLVRLLCTHHHVDHYGASEPIRTLTGARVHLHPLEAERAAAAFGAAGEHRGFLARHGVPAVPPEKELPSPSRWVGTVYCPAVPDVLLADGDVVDLGGGRTLEAVWTPGHTPGHCCLLLRPGGVLFVGDHLLPKITPHVGVGPDGPENPLGDFLASQEKIARVEASLVCPAHGGVYDDHRRRARQIVDFHRVRKLAMLEIIGRRASTAYEVALEAFAIEPDNRFQVVAATSETLAHLELLRREGRALRMDDDGVVRWSARRL